MSTAARLGRWLPALLLAGLVLAAAEPRRDGPLVVAIAGLTEDELEPCGCGGRTAGGLARRTRVIAGLRRDHPGLILIDAGGFGVRPDRLPLTARVLGYQGVDACGLSADDLADFDAIQAAAARHAVPLTSAVPPLGATAPPPPESLLVGPQRGPRLGLVSLAFRHLSIGDMTRRCGDQVRLLRENPDCRGVLLVSHLGEGTTKRLVNSLEPAARPHLVVLASGFDEPGPARYEDGLWWVEVARKGRSVIVCTLSWSEGGRDVEIDPLLLDDGPVDDTVQRWVDDYYSRLRAGLPAEEAPSASFPAVGACLPCHEAAVAAWRLHRHAHAVQTLVERHRDVAACLVCHSETFRRDGLRPAAEGDAGVQCATCHDGLPAHLEKTAAAPPGSLDRAGCESCHTPDNSPAWDYPHYLARVRAACRGETP